MAGTITIDRPRWMMDLFAALLLASLFAMLWATRFARQPELIYGADWVLGESGNQLFRADCVAAGKVIYRDFACQYGPLPTYFYGLIASALGNDIIVNQVTHLIIRMFAVLACYTILRSRFGPAQSLSLGVIAGVPLLLPGGSTGGFAHIEYISIEVLTLSSIMALYRSPERRGLRRNLLIGLLLGLCQWVKFGGGVVAGIAILAIDLIWLLRVGPERARMKPYFVGLATILVMAAVMESLFACFVLIMCPPEVARDATWPSYMLSDYATYTNRWPPFVTWKVFFARQLMPLSCLALGTTALVRDLRARFAGASGEGLGAYVGLVLFCVGSVLYLKHEFLIYQYSWSLFPAGCLALFRIPRPVMASALLAWVPATALLLKMTFLPTHPASLTAFILPTKEVIYLEPLELSRVKTVMALTDAVKAERGNGRIFFANGWAGSGYYHYLSPAPPIRNVFLVPHGFRPYDDRELASKLDRISAFIWGESVDPDKALRSVLTAGTIDQIMADFEVVSDLPGSPGLVTVLERRGDYHSRDSSGKSGAP